MRIITLLLLLLAIGACNLAPRYDRPNVELPCSWRMESDQSSTLANLRWWESLGDSVLDSLIMTALENNKDLQIAVWRVCEYYAQYQIVRSSLFPQIDLEASALKERFPVDGSFLPAGFNPVTSAYSWDFTLSYEIDFWGEVRNASRAAYAEFLAQVENRRTVVLTLVSSVAQAYVLLRQLDLEMEIAQATLQSRKESLQIATLRFEGGLTSEIEVTQADAAYQETLASIKILEAQIPQQENLLSILLGENPGPIARGERLDALHLPAAIPTGSPSDLLIRRPDIVKVENQLIAAYANIGVARAAFFPQLSFAALYGGESFKLNSLFSKTARTWQIGGNLLQAIFTGGRLTGQLNVSKAQQKETLFLYEQTILTALKEVNDALIGHQKARELVTVYKAQVIDLQQYLHLSWLRYNEGQTDYLTFLDAERQLFSSEISLAQAQGNLFISLAELYKSLGGGWVIDADLNLRKAVSDCDETPTKILIPAEAN